MDYRELSEYCSYGWADDVKKMLKKSSEKYDLFWHDYHLFKKAVMQGGAAVLNVLIEYYKETELNGLEEGSDKYLHKMQPLVKAMQETYDFTTRILPDVLKVFKQYGVVLDDDADSTADLDDMETPAFEDMPDPYVEGNEWHGQILGGDGIPT
jgi:hypothetical protein